MKRQEANQPDLIMFSHCVPEARGGVERARVWQLLRIAAAHHRVHLLCIADGPVGLSQWRSLTGLVHTIHLTPIDRPFLRWPSGRCSPWSLTKAAVRRLSFASSQQLGRVEPAAVICTSMDLAPLADRFDGADIYGDWPAGDDTRKQLVFGDRNVPTHITPLGGRRSVAASDRRRRPSQCESLNGIDTLQLDLDAYPAAVAHFQPADLAEPGASAASRPIIAYHADWSTSEARRGWFWFRSKVWPSIHRMMPEARLKCTHTPEHRADPRREPQMTDALSLASDAAIVVNAQPDGVTGFWPAVQAMAIGRAVVVRRCAATAAPVQDGREMMLAETPAEWTSLCLGLLQSESLRSNMGAAGRQWVQEWAAIQSEPNPFRLSAADPEPVESSRAEHAQRPREQRRDLSLAA